jgi:anti-sigma regulatory factor (Ser/Thr protein kinase)
VARDVDPPHVEIDLSAAVTAPADARVFLREALRSWDRDGFGAVTELLTDELVANVVRHVGEPMTLRATCHPDWIRVEVTDPDPDPPVPHRVGPEAERGRGLQLVDGLSDRWGVEPTGSGKTVWFEINVDTATNEVHDHRPPD